MLHVVAGEQLTDLAVRLAAVLAVPPEDPMVPEWVVVPTAGVARWVRLQLAGHLGASAPGATDGIAANVELLYPGRLRQLLLRPARADDDPWEVSRLTWSVLAVLAGADGDPALAPAAQLPPGATRWARARRIADLFDRYLLHRPAMVRRWEAGDDVDAWGSALPARVTWQPALWRAIQALIDEPSPASQEPGLLAALRSGACPPEVPTRLALFGVNTVPGGRPFVDLLAALGQVRDVHLLLHQPSAAMIAAVRAQADVVAGARRRPEILQGVAHHPLLTAWARPAREAVALLAGVDVEPLASDAGEAGRAVPDTLLGRVQADVRADRAPTGDFRPDGEDASIRVHACHGPGRQVEVLRDHLLHLLADDPTLTEDEIVVLCPALPTFAPLIEARWGASAADGAPVTSVGPPALAYRIADRSLGTLVPVLGALATVVDVLAGRCSDAAILAVAGLAPVRQRFGFDDADLATLAEWVAKANVRWGMDGPHRARWGVPASLEGGTWSTAIDRLLLGALVSDDPEALGPDGLLPIGVEGGDVGLAGRFADLLARLAALADASTVPRPIAGWLAHLREISEQLFATDPDSAWQDARLVAVLDEIDAESQASGAPSEVPLAPADLRVLLGRHLQATAGRADFFRGGITVSSLTPLRGVPYRVVCLLGLDETSFGASAPDGDDLLAASPAVGDRDRRAETRQALLDALLSAGSHLIITRTGRSIVTNQPVPPAVALAELMDAVAATVAPEVRRSVRSSVEIVHPRQGYDTRNFLPGEVDPSVRGPWSFDALACDGARQRRSPVAVPVLIPSPLPAHEAAVIDLADLRAFLRDPLKHFLRRRLEVVVPDAPDRAGGRRVSPGTAPGGIGQVPEGSNLLLELDALQAWGVSARMLDARRAGADEDAVASRELAADQLPPARLGRRAIDGAAAKVAPLLASMHDHGAGAAPPEQVAVDVVLPDGTRIIGAVRDDRGHRPGPVTVLASSWHDRHRLVPWLDLLVLTAADPTPPWWSVLIAAKPRVKVPAAKWELMELPGEDAAARTARAVAALEVVVDLYHRGMREPLPVFSKTSACLGAGKDGRSDWEGNPNGAAGEGSDPWVQMAFGRLSYRELLDLPVHPHDPAGRADERVRRYAEVLWGAVQSSLQAPADAEVSP